MRRRTLVRDGERAFYRALDRRDADRQGRRVCVRAGRGQVGQAGRARRRASGSLIVFQTVSTGAGSVFVPSSSCAPPCLDDSGRYASLASCGFLGRSLFQFVEAERVAARTNAAPQTGWACSDAAQTLDSGGADARPARRRSPARSPFSSRRPDLRLSAAVRRRDVLAGYARDPARRLEAQPAGTGGALHPRPRSMGAGRCVALSHARRCPAPGTAAEADRPSAPHSTGRRRPTDAGGARGGRAPGAAGECVASRGPPLTRRLAARARRMPPGESAAADERHLRCHHGHEQHVGVERQTRHIDHGPRDIAGIHPRLHAHRPHPPAFPCAMRAVISVSALPMSICPHAMSYFRPSSAVDFVRPAMACFVAVYGAEFGRGVCAEIEPLLMMRPPRGAWFSSVEMLLGCSRTCPDRFVSTTACHWALVSSSSGTAGARCPHC